MSLSIGNGEGDVEPECAKELGQRSELTFEDAWPSRGLRLRLDDRNGERRRFVRDHAMHRARDGEERIHRPTIWRFAIRRHDEKPPREKVRTGRDQRAPSHRAKLTPLTSATRLDVTSLHGTDEADARLRLHGCDDCVMIAGCKTHNAAPLHSRP